GGFEYKLGMHDVMHGLQGDTMLVNGAVNPFLEVPRGMMRLRLLNGSNASVYELNFNNHQSFHQIARDRKSTRLNSSHVSISYAVFCLKKKKKIADEDNELSKM